MLGSERRVGRCQNWTHPPAIGPKGSKPGSVLCPGKSHLCFRKHNLFEEKVVLCQHWAVAEEGGVSWGS